MLDTKLKNRHKSAVVLILLTVLLPSFFMLGNYAHYKNEIGKRKEQAIEKFTYSKDFFENFLVAGYSIYNSEIGGNAEEAAKQPDSLEELSGDGYYSEALEQYQMLYPYLDYRAEDAEGKVVAKSIANSGSSLTDKKLTDYALAVSVSYDAHGEPDVKILKGDQKTEQSVALRRAIAQFSESSIGMEIEEMEEEYGLQKPENQTFLYAMTQKNLQKYLNQYYNKVLYSDTIPDSLVYFLCISFALVALMAWILPRFQSLGTGGERVFRLPLEVLALSGFFLFGMLLGNMNWLLTRNNGTVHGADVVLWILVFAFVYVASANLRQIRVLGIQQYLKQCTILVPSWKYLQNCGSWCMNKGKKLLGKIEHALMDINLKQESSRAILKIVGINFIVLAAICILWFYGIVALLIYSVILFLFLRKFFNDLKEKYAVLLRATNEIAEGNLEVEITEDLGVFTPFKAEIEKIQHGFKKAVEDEVKSQHMKTELITNVSHDLKTPLTAIITYVNLLKDEKDTKKQNDYIEVLEKKSLRLKVLIEDLFEISKASSENVTMNWMDVDVVNLLKQAKLELEDKFSDAGLEFRCSYPEEKIVLRLDSQKTYRIFENLLVNIAKYALPGTRVYVDVKKEGDGVAIQMKNISAQELNFNPKEITDRFVRGDAARNTEGSGLGLAIAKSFVELQNGTFKIETEADLFKAEVKLGT